ncbi:MAG TPA: DUF3558 family protein [Acidimicrobiales bacterium]|nr:DUF3558 family protein [Acidimicrobiales bacterium]
MRKTAGVIMLVVLALAACGDDSGSAAAPGTSGADAPAASAASGTAATVDDACALVTVDEVAAVTQVEVTPDPQPSSAVSCVYDSPQSGIFYSIFLQQLPKGDQNTFDQTVAGQEQGFTITPIDGVGDGKAAIVEHADNHIIYARKGNTLVSITVFDDVNDPAAAAKALMNTALGRL